MPNQNKKPAELTYDQLFALLLDQSRPFPPKHLHRFSDLPLAEFAKLKAMWLKIAPDRRAALVEDLEDLTEVETTVDFEPLARFCLRDPDARVRTHAISMLWESINQSLIPVFIRLAKEDPEPVVRASAAGALGAFVFEGELEDLPETIFEQVIRALFEIVDGNDQPLVRRRALEALGFSSKAEVFERILKAYSSGENEWIASALFAMGRSGLEKWHPYIIQHLDDEDADIQLEAVRAAGPTDLQAAIPALLALIDTEDEVDEELRGIAIFSASQIGGEGVRATLERLMDETEDEDEADLLETALDNLMFTEQPDLFDILNIQPQSETELIEVDPTLATSEEDEDPDHYGQDN